MVAFLLVIVIFSLYLLRLFIANFMRELSLEAVSNSLLLVHWSACSYVVFVCVGPLSRLPATSSLEIQCLLYSVIGLLTSQTILL